MTRLLLLRFSPLLLVFLFACHRPDYPSIAPMGDDHWLRMVVETPAGQNFISRYEPESRRFKPGLQLNSKLPDFWNLGFVPGGFPKSAEKNFRLAEVVLLSLPKTQGTVLKIVPLAMLQMQTGDGPGILLLAAPADPSDRLAGTDTPEELMMEYPDIFVQIEQKLALDVFKAKPESLTWIDQTETWQFVLNMIENQ